MTCDSATLVLDVASGVTYKLGRCLPAEGSYIGSRFGRNSAAKHPQAPSRDASQTSIHADASRHNRLPTGHRQTEGAQQHPDSEGDDESRPANDRLFPDTAVGHMAMVGTLQCTDGEYNVALEPMFTVQLCVDDVSAAIKLLLAQHDGIHCVTPLQWLYIVVVRES